MADTGVKQLGIEQIDGVVLHAYCQHIFAWKPTET